MSLEESTITRTKRIEGAKVDYHPIWLKRWRQDPFSVLPLYLEISPVGMCNHRCTFCAPEMLGYPKRKLDADLLCLRFAELKQMRERDPDGLGVSSIQFAGEGEPTLHPDLAKIYRGARQAGIDVAMLTNATCLTPKLSEQIIPLVNGWLQASINAGKASTYSKIHRTKEKHWDLIWSNLANAIEIRHKLGLSAVDCEIGANMTVLIDEVIDRENDNSVVPSNWREMEMLAAKAKSVGLDYVAFKPYSQHPYSEATARLYGQMSYSEIMNQIEAIGQDITNRYQTKDFEIVFRKSRFREYEQDSRGYQTCLATPTIWSYIQSDGVWITCSAHWTNEKFHIGNVSTQTIQEIWFGEQRRQHLNFILNEFDISVCRKTCHPDKENIRMTQLKTMSEKEFADELVRLETSPRPRTANFI